MKYIVLNKEYDKIIMQVEKVEKIKKMEVLLKELAQLKKVTVSSK